MAVDGASTLAAITMALGKYRVAHSTTVAIVPPEHLWPPIQAARERLRDGGLTRWPPHVNLIYPFVEPPYFERFAERFAPAVAQCAPFRVRLERLGVFGSSRRGVVWLDPVVVGAADGERPWARLHERLCAVAPELQSPGRPFVPHMTITHTESCDAAREIADELGAEWAAAGLAVEFDVQEVFILCRSSATEPFRLAWRLPLGEGAPAPRADPRAFESMPTPSSLNWRPRERESLHAKMRAAYRARQARCRASEDGSS
ncbi:hypothetical protein KFE25_007212 [Diacronema lutheri]|uniref:2'-5' RNA ligase family protein n=2 Tax=Diacronema lutheri TaxID=2081491 RepID=A0A8J5XZ43_DIALT|nr:hypothetical protein KFE25_007212 [Diacronema lutheri]